MANPQTEKGHIRIANDLWEALCQTDLSGVEFRVLSAIIRITWGWHDKSKAITQDELMKLTGIKKPSHISRATDSLCIRHMLIKFSHKGKPTEYAANKDFDQWTNTMHGNTTDGITGNTVCGITSNTLQGTSPSLHENKSKTNTKHMGADAPCVPRLLLKWIELFRIGTKPKKEEVTAANSLIAELENYDEDRAITYLIAWHDNEWPRWRSRNPDKPAPLLQWHKIPLQAYLNGGKLPSKLEQSDIPRGHQEFRVGSDIYHIKPDTAHTLENVIDMAIQRKILTSRGYEPVGKVAVNGNRAA